MSFRIRVAILSPGSIVNEPSPIIENTGQTSHRASFGGTVDPYLSISESIQNNKGYLIPYKSFLHLTSPTTTLQELCSEIYLRFRKLYPEEG